MCSGIAPSGYGQSRNRANRVARRGDVFSPEDRQFSARAVFRLLFEAETAQMALISAAGCPSSSGIAPVSWRRPTRIGAKVYKSCAKKFSL
jgi:hypothetical protein